MKDKTFVILGVEIFVILLVFAIICAKTIPQWLLFIGVLFIIEIVCYLAHEITNDNKNQKG